MRASILPKTLLEMNLQELRQKLTAFSQEEIAEMLEVTQGYGSKLERQDDILLSKLHSYVEALGGELEIRARFGGREVRVRQFGDVEQLRAALSSKVRR